MKVWLYLSLFVDDDMRVNVHTSHFILKTRSGRAAELLSNSNARVELIENDGEVLVIKCRR